MSRDLLIVEQDAKILALDRTTGEEQWQFAPEGTVRQVATTDSVVVVSAVSGLDPSQAALDVFVLDAATGETRFTAQSTAFVPTLVGNTLVVSVVEDETDQVLAVRGLGLEDGSVVWETALSNPQTSTALMVEGPDLFYVISTEGEVTALTHPTDRSAPVVAFESRLDGPASSATDIHLSNGFLVEYRTDRGKLRVYK